MNGTSLCVMLQNIVCERVLSGYGRFSVFLLGYEFTHLVDDIVVCVLHLLVDSVCHEDSDHSADGAAYDTALCKTALEITHRHIERV